MSVALLLTWGAPIHGASPPQPTYGTAVVDGNISEWDLTNDFFGKMYRAFKTTQPQEANYYLRYNCATQTMYVLVQVLPGVEALEEPANAWATISGVTGKVYTGSDAGNTSPPQFAWVGPFGTNTTLNETTATGYEASFNIAPGSYTIVVHVEVFDSGAAQTAGSAGNGDSLVISCPTGPDLTIAKTHSGSFTVGTNGVYTLTVTNVGADSTTNTITVTDTLPTGLSFISGTGTGWSCSAIGQSVTCTNPGPLAPNASSTITLTVSVDSAAVPSVTNTASVSTSGDTNQASKNASDFTTVNSTTANSPTISTSLSSSTITVGGSVYDTATLSGATSTAGGTVTYTVYTDSACTLNPQAAGTVTVTNGTVPNSNTITFNSAGTFYWQAVYSGDSNNNGATSICTSEQLTVNQTSPPGTAPDLSITKTHVGNFTVGTNGVYTITVTNVGNGSTTGTITVTDTLPTGLMFVSGTGIGWSCSAAGQTVTCISAGPLAPNASSTITLTVSVSSSAGPNVTNMATVATPGDTNAANNSASDPTTISTAPLNACVVDPGGHIFLAGDVDEDGKVQVDDAVLAAQAALGLITLTPDQIAIADVAPPKGVIDIRDAIEIARIALGFPCDEQFLIGATAEAPTLLSNSLQLEGSASWQSGGLGTIRLTSDQSLLGLQAGPEGGLRFDPRALRLVGIHGVNGYQVLAQEIDNVHGIAKFLVVDPNSQSASGVIIELVFQAVSPVTSETTISLLIDRALDSNGSPRSARLEKVIKLMAPLHVRSLAARSTARSIEFVANGEAIAQIEVQVFGLDGHPIFRATTPGSRLRWQMLDQNGQPLANGVYLYVITVRDRLGDTWASSPEKLLVLRRSG